MGTNLYDINVDLGERSYDIHVGYGNHRDLVNYLQQLALNHQVAVISTPPVSELYLSAVINQFDRNWYVKSYDVPDGEKSKSAGTVSELYTWLLENKFERKSTLITLGGGVVGDLGGFVAATYLRGVNLIHLPTSLLAQVDSSIGGKVGINHPLGKNLIGSFYQPKKVITDVSCLNTLPVDEFICGLGEVVKYAIIEGGVLFEKISNRLDAIGQKDPDFLTEIVRDCIQSKVDIVIKDEMEQGIRAYLNLGHTFAHALETYYHYQGLKHGQAVLLGIKCAVQASHLLQLTDTAAAKQISDLIDRMKIELPRKKAVNRAELVTIMKKDKKIRDGIVHLVLPQEPGKIIVVPVTDEKILMESFAVLDQLLAD